MRAGCFVRMMFACACILAHAFSVNECCGWDRLEAPGQGLLLPPRSWVHHRFAPTQEVWPSASVYHRAWGVQPPACSERGSLSKGSWMRCGSTLRSHSKYSRYLFPPRAHQPPSTRQPSVPCGCGVRREELTRRGRELTIGHRRVYLMMSKRSVPSLLGIFKMGGPKDVRSWTDVKGKVRGRGGTGYEKGGDDGVLKKEGPGGGGHNRRTGTPTDTRRNT